MPKLVTAIGISPLGFVDRVAGLRGAWSGVGFGPPIAVCGTGANAPADRYKEWIIG
jgi:hypothetical protein